MEHYLYWMRAKAPAPMTRRDTESWFKYYKWEVEGETFVPRLLGPDVPPWEIKEGDRLWFSMDDWIIGAVPVLRVELEESQDKQEIWYDPARALVIAPGEVLVDPRWVASNRVPAADAESMLHLYGGPR